MCSFLFSPPRQLAAPLSLISVSKTVKLLFYVIAVKEGSPSDEKLEELTRKIGEGWKPLGRRLGFKEAELTGFHKENEEYSEKPYQMLLKWKQKGGTSGATYEQEVKRCKMQPQDATGRDTDDRPCLSSKKGKPPDDTLTTGLMQCLT